MGIKNFSKTFTSTRIVKFKDLKGQTLAIDAMTEIYRAALGAKSISVLTDAQGNPTLHISVILATIIELHKNNINQIWVFDHNQDPNAEFHNPIKMNELAKRKKRKDIAIEQIKSLADVVDDQPLFSDDDNDAESPAKIPEEIYVNDERKPPELSKVVLTDEETKTVESMSYRQKAQFMLKKTNEARAAYDAELSEYAHEKNKKTKLASLEKQTFSVTKSMIADVKFMMNCLNIKYIEAPKGFEGEAIASYLTKINKADAVFSGDTDPIAYGATVLLRRNPRDKQIYEYTQADILSQIAKNEAFPNPTIADLHKIAMILGTDACEKTPGIGPATVIKKLDSIKLTKAQTNAIKEFVKVPDEISINNEGKTPFENYDLLVDWLVTVKSFTRSRVLSQLTKVTELIEKPIKSANKPVKKPTLRKNAL